MKKIIGLILYCCIVLSACNDEKYSCDPEADKWVKENLSDVRLMTRSSWIGLSPGLRTAAFAAFTPQQKIDFWKNRFEQALLLDWNEQEKAHINKLYNKIIDTPEWFTKKKNDDMILDFDRYMFEWMDTALEELKWTKELLGALVASGDDLLDKSGTLSHPVALTMLSSRSESGSTPDCNCSKESDWCSTASVSQKCKTAVCKEVDGCGTLFWKTCDGRCAIDL